MRIVGNTHIQHGECSLRVAAILAAGESLAQVTKLRKEVRTLTSAEVATLRAGVGAMKALARDNLFSWDYQRACHNSPSPFARADI